MSRSAVDAIARAVLYEGYILYPYRPSVKSRQRWTFGGIFPRAYSELHPESDPAAMEAQCLVLDTVSARMSITLRFLHLTDRIVERAPAFDRVQSIHVGEREYQSWQEAVEREVHLDQFKLNDLLQHAQQRSFFFPSARVIEMIHDGDQIVGRIVREQQSVEGVIELSAARVTTEAVQLTARVLNQTPIAEDLKEYARDRALMRSFASTHLVFKAMDGEFVSLTDPPAGLREPASGCRNIGCWPVLVGEADQADTLLASPIILPDYPEIAPESPGDLFDGCEIDEILSLRIMTLTDAEKRQASSVDERVRHMLERTEALAREQMMNLHGSVRGLRPVVEPPHFQESRKE